MKVLLQTFFCCILTISMYAQKNHPTLNTQAEKTNWINFKAAEQTSAAQLAENKTVLYLQEKDNLNLIAEQTDQLGTRHYRYQQTYDGIPIEGAIYIFHEKENRVKHANGKLVHQLNLNTLPSISVDAALTSALTHIDAELYAWDDPMHENGIKEVKNEPDATFYPSGKLVIIDPEFKQQNINCKLAYKFDIYAVKPYTRQEVFVDAHNGSIITTIEKIHNCNDVSATGTSNYHGDVSFTACQHDETYTLKNNIGGGMQVFYDNYDGDNTQYSEFAFINNSSFFQNVPEAVDVHWATEATYNYFSDTLGRNSLDNDGMLLKSWVHRGDNLNNAAWTGWCMFYGDGDGEQYGSWTTPDIVAHEMAHGVTQYSANLIYQYESGALNESFSDIFGEMVEWATTGTNDWLIGADVILTPGINGLRNMSNPKAPDAKFQQPNTYNGEYWYTGNNNYGGVHTNSGVQNYWFYLLSEGGSGTNDNGYTYDISGIGKDKAAAIAYLNLTEYLTSTSNYADARAGSILAAQDLQEQDILTASDVQQVEEAWCAVGVGCGNSNPCAERDSLALVALYNATNGANWTNTWDLNQPIDTWYEVIVNEDKCVTELNLVGNQLSGSIPPEIGNLSNLWKLKLDSNQLINNIPPEIGNLSNLRLLYLRNNQLSGNIPPEIGNLNNLWLLLLSNNQLSGNIPPEIGDLNNLSDLYLNNNQLSGNIPPEIGNLNDPWALWFNNNQLSGNIPPEICNFAPWDLRLDNNQLSGNIPPEIGNLWAWDLRLDNNQLSGNIPSEIGNLWASNLRLDNNQLSGDIPPEIGNLSVQSLSLNDNQLSGNIPPEIGNMPVQYLYLNDNQLSGCYDIRLWPLCNSLIEWEISEGNNFDEPWATFCNTGMGSCAPIMITCENDSLALVALYNATNGANWANTWDLNQPMDTWYGVTINEDRCITELDLFNNQLSGNIPPEIGNLANLWQLQLDNNQLSGNIPPEIGGLSSLRRLYLYDNQLSGNIPPEIGDLNILRYLDLKNNQLSGNIPPEIGNLNNLTQLYLADNQLSGNIPPEVENMSNLASLYLSNNELSGNIPHEIGNINNLVQLYLNNNQLSGNIPPEIGNISNLSLLYLNDNQLTGNIPSEIGNLGNLRQLLNLGNNQLTGNIPPEIGNLGNLKNLSLNGNQLTGNIPPEIGDIVNLEELHLNENQLSGNIPPEIENLDNLVHLHLNDNQLSGNIPSGIGNLNRLENLYLYDNQLSGNIPSEIGNLNRLENLYLYDNQLSNIPSEIGNLNNLVKLHLWNNQLIGNIPPEIGNLNNLQNLVLYNNQLIGNIPSEIGNLNNLQSLQLYNNQLSGNIPPEIGNLPNLTYLGLSQNQLSGNIPPEIGNLSNLQGLWLYNNQLTGCYNPNLYNLCGQLTSYNISHGNNFNATWDHFCNTQAGRCPVTPVLPGDFNNDGTANQHDILYWGLAKDYVGAVRPDSTTDWIPQECPEWEGYINSINLHHADGDGNGTVDNNDLLVLQQNFGLTQDFSVPSESPSSSIFLMSELSTEPSGYNTKITYELYLQSDVPVSTHGISGSIDLSDVPNILSASIDTIGSTLRPDAYIGVYDDTPKVIQVGLTKTSKNNQLVNGSIGILSIIISKDIQVGDPTELRTNGGSMISSNGVVTPIAGSTLYIVPNSATPDLPVSLSLNHAYCGLGGTATAYAWEGTAPYTYTWSTGESTASVNNLPIGMHSLTVTDALGLSKAIDFEIEWAFTPVEVSTSSKQICLSFANGPLSEAVQISLDGGMTYESPITTDTCYNVPAGTYHIWIQRVADQCPVDLGMVDIIVSSETPEKYEFDVQLLNTAGQESRVTYNIAKQGILNMSLYNTHGQQVMTLHNGISYQGHHQIPIDKSSLPSGIYFIHIEYIVDDIPINKILKLPVMK